MISLVLAFSTIIVNLVLAGTLKSMPTQLFLHEHQTLINDWTTQPFVDITLEDSKNGCPEGYEPLFHRMWNGTYDICEVPRGENHMEIIVIKDADRTDTLCKDGTVKKGSPPQNLTSITGLIACALRGGPTFTE